MLNCLRRNCLEERSSAEEMLKSNCQKRVANRVRSIERTTLWPHRNRECSSAQQSLLRLFCHHDNCYQRQTLPEASNSIIRQRPSWKLLAKIAQFQNLYESYLQLLNLSPEDSPISPGLLIRVGERIPLHNAAYRIRQCWNRIEILISALRFFPVGHICKPILFACRHCFLPSCTRSMAWMTNSARSFQYHSSAQSVTLQTAS